MTLSPKDVAAPGLPKPSTKFRPDWLRPILPAIALALVTTAPDPGATYNGGRNVRNFLNLCCAIRQTTEQTTERTVVKGDG